ncbi:hypothetical protein NXX05_24180 [Bacteroides thetaiotaomicron]|uniref:lipid-binding protein n=1 Tax=Bacteroides thetaiotaomicron TaxID=818 RepID=UPI002165B2D5|nr:lipid-binding protein [Bacteroides thetaiotaomicron]MCS2850460.1 hypothetical protein [Bacteroides thetaiotaomicron]
MVLLLKNGRRLVGDSECHFIDRGKVEDPFGAGHLQMSTYNTASNSETEVWLDDLGNFWEYKKLKVNVNYAARTFSTTGFVDNVTYESKVNN